MLLAEIRHLRQQLDDAMEERIGLIQAYETERSMRLDYEEELRNHNHGV